MEKDLMLLPLQYFADGEEEKETEEKAEPEARTYSESEVDSKISRAVESALKREREKAEKLLSKAKEEGVTKGKTYAQLSEEDRKSQELADKEKELQEREESINKALRLAQITEDLKKENLPAELGTILSRETDDSVVKDVIKAVKGYIDTAVNNGVKESLRQDTPKSNTPAPSSRKGWAEIIAEKNNSKTAMEDPWVKK